MATPVTLAHSRAQLVRDARGGSAEALGALYDAFGTGLFRLAYRLTGSREDAEDTVHDVFVGVPEALERYEERGQLGAWLRRVSARVALMRQRSRQRRRETALESATELAGLPAITAEQLALRAAVDALPAALRNVLVLKEMEGYSHAEIAELLRNLPVPEPSAGLRDRIVATRVAGGGVALPATDPRSRRNTVRYTGLIAAAAALAALLFARSAGRRDAAGGVAEFLAGVPLWPRAAFAQAVTDTTARARYQLLDKVAGRMARGRWVYDARLIVDGIDTTSQGIRTLTTGPGSEPGTLVLTTDQTHRFARPMGDSLVVDGSNLRILRHTFYYQSKSHTQDFARDTIPHFVTWRNVDIGWHGTLYRALLQATPLNERWRGSVYLPWAVGKDRWVVSPLDLRVTHEETVTTPAGRFLCWVVEASFRGRRVLVWVSQSPQWVVKLGQPHGGDAVWEQVLVSATPPAP